MELANLIYDIKEKLTDAEYKNIMETIGEKRDKVLCKVEVAVPSVRMFNEECCEEINLLMKKYERIMELSQELYEKISKDLPKITGDWCEFKIENIIEPVSFISTEHYCESCDTGIKENDKFKVGSVMILKCEKMS